jgi:DNA/RNA endonuclease G (NUC1)
MYAVAPCIFPTVIWMETFMLNIKYIIYLYIQIKLFPKVIGENRVAVPSHFFKAVLIEPKKDVFELEVYMMPNAPIPNEKPISDFYVPLDSVERSAGFLIFENLPKNNLKRINDTLMNGGGFLSFLTS